MQNIATSNLSIININNKTSTNPLVRFSGFPSTKSRFLCFIGIRNPRFQAIRAQNRGFCVLLGSGTTVFGHFEHKIKVFVLFWPSEPPFSGISSTKSRFVCAFCLQNPNFRASRAQNRHFCARADGELVLGSVKWSSCKSPSTLPKYKYLITR